MVSNFEYSIVQPNPGWGKLCDSCRHLGDREDAQMPCKIVEWAPGELVAPNLFRRSIKGRPTKLSDVYEREFEEICSSYFFQGWPAYEEAQGALDV